MKIRHARGAGSASPWRIPLEGIRVEELPLPEVRPLDRGHPRALADLVPLALDRLDLVVDELSASLSVRR